MPTSSASVVSGARDKLKGWGKAFADPFFAIKFHKWAAIVWFILAFPICIFLSNSIPLIVFVSVYAIVVGHWGSYQAAAADIQAMDDD